ncbi:MAG: hypothetical protein Q8O99_03415 [bacterium]|nr:hypothetical protein [bacterium]
MVDRLYDNPNFLVMSEQDMRAASDSDQQSRLNKLATNELSETPDEKYFFDASSIDKKLPVGSPKDKQKMRNEVIGAEPLVIKN